MHIRRTAAALAATTVVAAALALAGPAAPAAAAPADAAALAATNSASPTARSSKAGLTAEQYWTPQRMAAAVPADQPAPAAPKDVATVMPRTGPKGSSDGVAAPKAVSRAASIHSMTGRVFYVDNNGANRSCSGSTVNSAGKRLVFTAGHCVHGGGAGQTWFDVNRWVFVPNYHSGSPYGTWSAFQQWTKTGWINDANRAYDVAAVVMQDKNGQRIVDAVGGQGIKWGYGYGLFEYMFGYPSNPPYNGSQLYYCYGTTRNEGGFPTLDCSMTGGASGGPWLENYGVTFWAYVNGVNSWLFWRNDPTQVYKWQSPYFSYDTAGSLFDTVKNM
jgi:V8-like Glu-specific endopeptidase